MASRQIQASAPALVTLAEALRPYPMLSKETLRRLIVIGKLPATKVGRYLLVAQSDVDALFRPKAQGPEAEKAEQAKPTVPGNHGHESCPSCGRMASADHRKVCGT